MKRKITPQASKTHPLPPAKSWFKKTFLYFISDGPDDPKHQGELHSFLSYFFMLAFCSTLLVYLSDQNNYYPTTKQLILGTWLFIYTLILFFSRYVGERQIAVYDMFWQCNVSLVLSSFGAFLGKRDIVGACVVSIALDQSMWWVDIATFATMGKFGIGVAKYITWPQTTWPRIVTATHHLWFIPLCAYMNDGLPWNSVWLSIVLVAVMSIISRYFIPFEIPFRGNMKYMNINCSYECWKDVKIWVLHLADRKF